MKKTCPLLSLILSVISTFAAANAELPEIEELKDTSRALPYPQILSEKDYKDLTKGEILQGQWRSPSTFTEAVTQIQLSKCVVKEMRLYKETWPSGEQNFHQQCIYDIDVKYGNDLNMYTHKGLFTIEAWFK